MASYDITLYLNSGFNSVNIPDNPARLASSATVITTVPAVQILQDRFLSQIDIQATWAQVEDCDYIKIGTFYYSVQGVQMLSTNVARLSITPDFITSAGGFTLSDGSVVTDFDILDGITERQTVSSDGFGAYTDDDPLMVPQRPLKLSTEWLNVNSSSENDHVLVETTIDLITTMGQGAGVTYTDEETGETVTVPQTFPALDFTAYSLDGSEIQSAYTKVYDRKDTTQVDGAVGTAKENIASGLQYVNALGVAQGSILNQWKVPANFATVTKTNPGTTVGTEAVEYTDQNVSNVAGASGSLSGTISANYGSPNNNRLLYGEYNRYGIITCAGNSIEAKPEEIMTSATTPSISYKADPRPDGKPYYRFTEMNSDTEFFRNCIAGSTWEQVPLIYQGASGSALTRLNFDNSRKSQELAQRQTNDTYAWNQIQNIGNTMANALGAASDTNALLPGYGMLAASGELIKGANNAITMGIANTQYNETYKRDKANELSQLYQNTTVYTPSVNFPYNADFIRDAKNNGILVYKYSYDTADLTRIDRLLTMYGYKEAEQLTPANFYRRTKFDYVQCSSVSITNLPRWWNDGIADQLRNGVRVWHTKPDSTAYSSNPIRS